MSDIRGAAINAANRPEPEDFGDYAAYLVAVADVTLDAVRPLIEADLRERLAAAIEALRDEARYNGDWEYADGLDTAARLTRERP